MSPMVRRPPGIELALLGFLCAGPLHGYQIHRTLSSRDGLELVWHLKQSQLYALLARLENDGHVTSVLQNQEPHPPRRVFELTPSGRNTYIDWLTCPVSTPRLVRQEFMAKLYFLRQAEKGLLRKLVDSQRAACQKWLDDVNSKKNTSTEFDKLIFEYRTCQIEAMLAWLDSVTDN